MTGFVEHCNCIVRWGLLGLIVFTPLAFGTVEEWSIAIMEWGIVTIFLIFMMGRLWPSPRPRKRGIWRTGLEWCFALFLIFTLFQTVPLPRSVLFAISPGSARLYGTEVPILDKRLEGNSTAEPEASEPLSQPEATSRARPVSLSPDKTIQRSRLAGIFMLLFLLIAWWADRRERILYLVTAVTVVGFLIALQALIQFMTWNGKILWFRAASGDRAFGPFVNHNHFAGYVEMIIPLAIGLSIYFIERWRYSPGLNPAGHGALEIAEDSPEIGGKSEGFREKGILALFAAVILVVALFFCMSRGGLLSALLSGSVLLAILWNRMLSKRLAWTIVFCLPLLIAGLIFWIGPEEVFEHIGSYDGFTNEASFRSRALVWQAILDNVGEFAWAGSGLGTFQDSFAPFTPPGATSQWHRAHNDYLQFLWETGLIGLSLLLFAAISFARRFWWPALRQRKDELDVIRIGAAVSLMSIAAHSLVDFNLQVGSNGFLFALLAGLLAAMTHSPAGDNSLARIPSESGGQS